MNEHIFARLHAALGEAGRERADALAKLAIAPVPGGRVERRPDQERMIAAHLSPHLQQPGHVEPVEWADDSGGRVVRHVCSRAACFWLAAVFRLLSGVLLPSDDARSKCAGQSAYDEISIRLPSGSRQ